MQFDWNYGDNYNIKCNLCNKRAHLVRCRVQYQIGDKYVDQYTYFVKCLKCGIEQPLHSDTPKEAIERWNRFYGNYTMYKVEVYEDNDALDVRDGS